MRFDHAIVRRPGSDLGAGITTAALGAPSYAAACRQHEAYVSELERAGLEVEVLEPLSGHPDAYFVEDVAVVLDTVAVLTRPGSASRRGEVAAMEGVLGRYRELVRIEAPGTLDGGDVLVVGGRGFIGLSERTNLTGAQQLAAVLAGNGITSALVEVGSGLHFKSNVNAVSDELLLVAEGTETEELAGFEVITVPAEEAYAANCLWVNDTVLVPAGFPRARALLDAAGLATVEVDVSEMRKMDGGLTCMSLRF